MIGVGWWGWEARDAAANGALRGGMLLGSAHCVDAHRFAAAKSGCCSTISTGEPTSRKKWWEPASISESKPQPPLPTDRGADDGAFSFVGGMLRLDERHPGGGPVQPGGRQLVRVPFCELAAEWPISAPRPDPAAGRANAPIIRGLARIFERVAFVAFQGHRPGDGSHVAVGKGDRHGLQMQFRASAFAFELVDFSLHKCAGRDHDLIAGVDRGSDLGIDVVSAMNVPALNGMSKHQGDSGSGGNRHGCQCLRCCRACDWLRVWGSWPWLV